MKPSTNEAQKQIVAVIESQLSAFRANDYAMAQTFATVGIRKQFPRDEFEKMVKKDYPAIANSKSASFGLVSDNGIQAEANVMIQGKSGKPVRYRYFMVKEAQHWKINGVVETPQSGDQAKAPFFDLTARNT